VLVKAILNLNSVSFEKTSVTFDYDSRCAVENISNQLRELIGACCNLVVRALALWDGLKLALYLI